MQEVISWNTIIVAVDEMIRYALSSDTANEIYGKKTWRKAIADKCEKSLLCFSLQVFPPARATAT